MPNHIIPFQHPFYEAFRLFGFSAWWPTNLENVIHDALNLSSFWKHEPSPSPWLYSLFFLIRYVSAFVLCARLADVGRECEIHFQGRMSVGDYPQLKVLYVVSSVGFLLCCVPDFWIYLAGYSGKLVLIRTYFFMCVTRWFEAFALQTSFCVFKIYCLNKNSKMFLNQISFDLKIGGALNERVYNM